MRGFVFLAFGATLVGYGLGLAYLAADARAEARRLAVLAASMPRYPQLTDPHHDARRAEYVGAEEAREAAWWRAATRLDQAFGAALTGLALLLAECGWLAAAWAGGGWASRSRAARTAVVASVWAAVGLPALGVIAELTVGERMADPRLVPVLPGIAAAGAVAGAAVGAVWAALRRTA